jgi:hypothetical protein
MSGKRRMKIKLQQLNKKISNRQHDHGIDIIDDEWRDWRVPLSMHRMMIKLQHIINKRNAKI